MIKVNLARKKNVGMSGAAESGASKININKLGSIRWDDIKELPLKTIVFCIAASYFAGEFTDNLRKQKLEEKDKEIRALVVEQEKLGKDLAKTKDFDIQRKQLEADEATMRGKIDAIQRLISDRMALYNAMVAMSGAIPAGVWLNDFNIVGETISFKGSSLDINQVSDFMKRLNESPHFKEITLKGTNQATDVLNFDLTAKRR